MSFLQQIGETLNKWAKKDGEAKPKEDITMQKPNATDSGTTPEDASKETPWARTIGGLIWVVIILGFIIYPMFGRNADIKLEVSPSEQLSISGVVRYKGAALSNGCIQITLDEPKTKRFLSSWVLDVSNDGKFIVDKLSQSRFATNRQLRITAAYDGQIQLKEGFKHIRGEEIRFSNFSPPIERINVWTGGVIILSIMGILMILFTGPLSRRKARCLFAVTFLMTFLSLAVPIGLILVVSQNYYLVELMDDSPVGLVKAKAKAVSDPQWLLNIGGIVQRQMTADLSERTTSDTNKATEVKPVLAQPAEKRPADSGQLEYRPATVLGGLAIPFYVVILAMFGAGINMTRRVPEIQKRYDVQSLEPSTKSPISATLAATVAIFTQPEKENISPQQSNAVAGIRRDIIESYMGFISAPFLAIAIYYVLQVIATSVAEPILVIMAFSTGLISDSVVSWIVSFAENMLRRKPTGGDLVTENETARDEDKAKPTSEATATMQVPATKPATATQASAQPPAQTEEPGAASASSGGEQA